MHHTSSRSTPFTMLLIVFSVLGFCSGGAGPAQAAVTEPKQRQTATLQPINPALAAELDRLLAHRTSQRRIPGVMLAINIPDRQPWHSARGLADRKQALAMNPTDHFRIGSVSKMFVATVVLQLVQENKLQLDAPISTWMPNVVPAADKMTLRHLLSHTSGLNDYLDNGFMRQVLRNRQRIWKPQELINYAVQRGAYFPPGAKGRWRYSNTDYVLLGALVEQITGHSLAQEVRQRIIAPLNLEQTFFEPDEQITGILVHGYAGAGDWTDIYMSYAWSTGSIVSTVDDLNRFAEALFGGRLLAPTTFAAMTSFVSAYGSFGIHNLEYGLGIMRNHMSVGVGTDGKPRPAERVLALGHIGGIGGYRAALWHLPDSHVTIALGFNEANVDPMPLSNELVDAVLKSLGK